MPLNFQAKYVPTYVPKHMHTSLQFSILVRLAIQLYIIHAHVAVIHCWSVT